MEGMYDIFIKATNTSYGLDNLELTILELFITKMISGNPKISLHNIKNTFNISYFTIYQQWTHDFIKQGLCLFHPNMRTPWSNSENYIAFKSLSDYIQSKYTLDVIPPMNIPFNNQIINITPFNNYQINNIPLDNNNIPLDNNDIPNFIIMWPEIIQNQYKNIGWILIPDKINRWHQIPANNAEPMACTWCKNISLCCKSGNSKKTKLCSVCWQTYW